MRAVPLEDIEELEGINPTAESPSNIVRRPQASPAPPLKDETAGSALNTNNLLRHSNGSTMTPAKADRPHSKRVSNGTKLEKPRVAEVDRTTSKRSSATKLEKPQAGHRGHGRTSSRRSAGNSAPPVQLNFVEALVTPLPPSRSYSYNQQIFWLLAASVLCSTIVLGISLGVSLGRSSFWIGPIVVALTDIFTLVVFVGMKRKVKETARFEVGIRHTQLNLDDSTAVITNLRARDPPVQIPKNIVERRGTTVCAWILFGLWIVVLTTLIANMILSVTGVFGWRRRGSHGVHGMEIAFTVGEVIILEYTAKHCREEWSCSRYH